MSVSNEAYLEFLERDLAKEPVEPKYIINGHRYYGDWTHEQVWEDLRKIRDRELAAGGNPLASACAKLPRTNLAPERPDFGKLRPVAIMGMLIMLIGLLALAWRVCR